MKKLFIISLAWIAFATSCTSDLNLSPVTETTSADVYSDPANYQRVLAKLYTNYVTGGQEKGGGNADATTNAKEYFDILRAYINVQEGGTDEMALNWITSDNLSGIAYIQWDNRDVWVEDIYYHLYYNITLCNEFLRNCTESAISGFSESEKEAIRGYRAEARFIRANTYSMVLDLFHRGPFVDETMGIGAYTPEMYLGPDFFAFIEKELNEIIPALPERNDNARASQGAGWFLLAKLYLNAEAWAGENHYSDCIAACRKVMEQGYSLENEFWKLFNADNHLRDNEIILRFVIDATETVSWGATTYMACGPLGDSNESLKDICESAFGVVSPWNNFRMRGEVAERFNGVIDKDARAMLFTTDQNQWLNTTLDNNATSDGYFSTKFRNITDNFEVASNTASDGATIDWPFMRLADVYLMAAEAVLRGGTGMSRAEALELVNKVRERAYGDKSGNISDADLTLDFLLDERGRELCLEAVRRTDLVRYDYFTTDKYLWQWKGGVVDGRSVDAKYNQYPIPYNELTANPNLSNITGY